MAELLVSVRSVEEAEAALRGGAGLIDVKEPSRGPLGKPSDDILAAIVRQVANRSSLSAALGELAEHPEIPGISGLRFVKWGLSGWVRGAAWRESLLEAGETLRATLPGCQPVAVAYADWCRANAPAPHEVCAFAQAHRWGAFLLDTWGKDGSTLLDWLSPAELGRLCHECRNGGVRVALAGSLGEAQIRALQEVAPDWFAVRGAACRGGHRESTIDAAAVRRLVELAAGALTATTVAG